MKLVTVSQMRALEQRADASGNSYATLMERAGVSSAQAIMERFAARDQRILALIGPGNNGGDGLVCARALHDAGARVGLYLWRRVPAPDDVNWAACMQRGIPYKRAEEDTAFAELRAALAQTFILIDALLGVGIARPIEGALRDLLQIVRAARANSVSPSPSLRSFAPPPARSASRPQPYTVAIDLPTGLDPDTGALDAAALSADLTVTFAFPKIGQFAFPGADAVGELVVADIGIPEAWANEIDLTVATPNEMRALLPLRPRNANKGTFGKAMLACGSVHYTGAPVLAARAASRVGAGLVTLTLPETLQPIIASKIDEATFLPLPDRLGDWRPRAANELLAALWDAEYDALLVGCGLGQSEGARGFLARLLENFNTLETPPTLILDADALNFLAALSEEPRALTFDAPPILTPHPGEMARLRNTNVASIQNDRVEVARDAARQWNAIIVLKGAFTVIAAPDGRVTLLPFANSALATAGTGDVLAGTIAGCAAQIHAAARRAEKLDALEIAYQAARLGAYLHALAGEFAARDIGAAGVVAGDLAPRLPQALESLDAA
ncbi:MAG: NAD(P)H-hydrate dehydratase [Chloroflexi bacterium UTCFX4]|nr:MAG: NAD(P)H-hydrate dehydratase [Chloroflexi bacterium UTCFX4]